MDNAADLDEVENQAQRDKNAEDTRLNDIKEMLSTPQGRRFLWNEVSEAGIFTTSFTGNSTTFFNEGRRSHGLRLLSDLVAADEAMVLQMFSENLKRELSGG